MHHHNREKMSYDNDDYSRFAGPEYIGKGPKDYQRSDGRIYEDVCEILLNDHRVDASDIEVEVHSGLVTLRGTVENRAMKKQAEYSLEEVRGVEDVLNLLKIKQFSQRGAEGLIKNQSRLLD